MNKSKKIAAAVVSTVLAGSMVLPLAACKPPVEDTGNPRPDIEATRFNAATSELTAVTVGGRQLYVKGGASSKSLAYPLGTALNVNVIDSGNVDRKISYDASQIAGRWDGLDGYTYYADDLKPAWWQFATTLGLDIKDVSKSGRSGSELSNAVSLNEMADYNLINASVAQISANTSQLLDLSQYLEYMPNYNKFLEDHPIVKWSLTMNAQGSMYYIPYFDGNDDIEKYCLTQKQWTEGLLDKDAPATDVSVTFKDQATAKSVTGTSSSVTSFMGTEGSWKVETTNPKGGDNGYVKVDYDAVKTAANGSTALNTAIKAAWSGYTSTESGNIVDIQNAVINGTQGEVKGSALLSILKEYIKVAYTYSDTENGTYAQLYGTTVGSVTTKLSDVFNSAYAAWDADLLTALYRCVVTNFKTFTGMDKASAAEIFALAGRENKAQRQNDLISLAGELYGVRGLESRFDYQYIDANGAIQDARKDAVSYDAAAKLNQLAKEGLLYTGTTSVRKTYKADEVVAFMLHDYLQTQTTDGFFNMTYAGYKPTGSAPADFNFAPIVTPVSHWDTDSNGEADTTMRFTESWRSVKNTGVAIPTASVSTPAALSAVLSFVDYLYSNDGQIVGSYGPMSTKGNTADADGFWYGTPATAADLGVTGDVTNMATMKTAGVVDTVDGVQYYVTKAYQGKCFTYNNVIYKGTQYKDKQIPTMTDNNMLFYLGKNVFGGMSTNNTVGIMKGYARNYTNYARGIVGAALPIGNKDQGFEYQCTAECGLLGADIVSAALNNGTIKHVTQNIGGKTAGDWWYTIVPSVLPVESTQSTTISGQVFLDGSSKAVGVFNPTSTSGYSNVYIDLAFYGYDTTKKIGTCGKTEGSYDMQADADSLVTYISTLQNNGLQLRDNAYTTAWNLLKTLFVK